MSGKTRRSAAEIEKLYEQACELVREGMLIKDACQKVGINTASFYRLRRQAQSAQRENVPKVRRAYKKRQSSQVTEIPFLAGLHEGTFKLSGTPEEIARFVAALSQNKG